MLKRSVINSAIDSALKLFQAKGYPLPPFAYWKAEDWAKKGPEIDELLNTRIGWDVTDFDSGDFANIGRTIFTLRNGKLGSAKYSRSYAQKIMYLAEGQKSVIHYHKSKTEDIINNGGGNILLKFWKALPDNSQSQEQLQLGVDGSSRKLAAGEVLRLSPGESVNIPPQTYHIFWAEEGFGDVLSMEVSSVCDDLTDNFWLGQAKRFPEILEDEPARYVLCSEYGNKL